MTQFFFSFGLYTGGLIDCIPSGPVTGAPQFLQYASPFSMDDPQFMQYMRCQLIITDKKMTVGSHHAAQFIQLLYAVDRCIIHDQFGDVLD